MLALLDTLIFGFFKKVVFQGFIKSNQEDHRLQSVDELGYDEFLGKAVNSKICR